MSSLYARVKKIYEILGEVHHLSLVAFLHLFYKLRL
jgi:hypothetical protein